MSQPSHNILNLDQLQLVEQSGPGPYQAKFAAISNHISGGKLGYRLTVLQPGKRAWPLHAHTSNEEMFFILSGRGSFRLGDSTFPVREGDVVAAPAGGAQAAHQMVNDSDAELRYLCVSTMNEPDISLYPESGKFGVVAGAAPGGKKDLRTFSHVGLIADAVDYWKGE